MWWRENSTSTSAITDLRSRPLTSRGDRPQQARRGGNAWASPVDSPNHLYGGPLQKNCIMQSPIFIYMITLITARKLTEEEAHEVYSRLWEGAKRDLAKKQSYELIRLQQEHKGVKDRIQNSELVGTEAGQAASDRLYRDAARRKRSLSRGGQKAEARKGGLRSPDGVGGMNKKLLKASESVSSLHNSSFTSHPENVAVEAAERLYEDSFASRERREMLQVYLIETNIVNWLQCRRRYAS